MGPNGIAEETYESLSRLIGQKLLKSRNFCATRHFYFGEPDLTWRLDGPHYTLGIECPWRIQTSDAIIVGSEDYYEQAEGSTDTSWEPGAESGHLQDQKLAELLGELKDGDAINTRVELVVDHVVTDRYGGFQIGLSGGYSIVVCPCSRGQMEWIFILPEGGSIMLMNAEAVRARGNRRKNVRGRRDDTA